MSDRRPRSAPIKRFIRNTPAIYTLTLIYIRMRPQEGELVLSHWGPVGELWRVESLNKEALGLSVKSSLLSPLVFSLKILVDILHYALSFDTRSVKKCFDSG